jgi:demethylmenaquinone methyltransferase/2-methoxy-6-polyprenyl-1,4-benzoquinol methylase
MPTATDVQGIFNRIAPVYDGLNQHLSLGLHRVWKAMAVAWSGARPGDVCLDLCCGSGDLALMLARRVGSRGQVYGVDFAVDQLAVAQRRSQSTYLPTSIHWIQADALHLPFADASFDAATLGYGLRNLTSIQQGLGELRRVLKPGARAAILDFHRPPPGWRQHLQQWYLDRIVMPAASQCGLTEEYAYLAPSLERFPRGPDQVELACQAGFSHAVHYPTAGGMMGVLVVSYGHTLG